MNKLIVAGLPRSGTSMMMRIIKMGGVPVEYDKKLDTPMKHKIFGNPYGFFETRTPSGFLCFKMTNPDLLKKFPSFKYIYIYRNMSEIIRSWVKTGLRVSRINIERNRAEFDKEINKYSHIKIEYDEMRKNPVKECTKIQDFIGFFNIDEAIKAIDYNI